MKSSLTYETNMIETCEKCLNESIPFHSLSEIEFEPIIGNSNINLSQKDLDRLEKMKFNPFRSLNDTTHKNDNFDNSVNLDDIKYNYYLPNEIKELLIKNQLKNNFSLLHLNIRSMSNKYDPFKHLLKSLNHPISVIGLRHG